MPKWWPWGRRPEPVAPAAPAAPAARAEPVWQRLAAVTPTTGDIEPTAHLNGFTATLTTSQNPAFTKPVQLLAVDEHHRLPVLDTSPAHPAPPPAAPAPAVQSRSWAPRLPSVQRAHVGTPVQRDSMQDEPVATTLPVIDTGGQPEPVRAMVQARDPDERRPLDAVTAEDASAELPAPLPDTSEPFTAAPTAVEHPAPPIPAVQRLATETHPLPATPIPAVQRLAAETHPLPIVLQRVASPSPPHPDSSTTTASATFDVPPGRVPDVPLVGVPDVYTAHHTEVVTPPLRHLHTVQRTDSVAPTIPSLPTLPVVTTTPSKPVTRPEQDAPKPQPTPVIQRITDADELTPDVADDGEQPAPAVSLPVVDNRDANPPLPVAAAAAGTPSVLAQTPPHAPAAVQRLTPQPNPPTPSPPVHTDPHPAPRPDTTARAVEAADLPVVTTEFQTAMHEPPLTTEHYEVPAVQRSAPVAFTAAEARPEPATRVQPVSVFASSQPQRPTVMRTVGDTPDVAANPMTPAAAPARTPITADRVHASESAVAERISLPVVNTAPTLSAAPSTRRPDPSAPPVVQRSTGSTRRLVVLPPVRSTDDHSSSPGIAALQADEAEVFSSPRPVGLQRMFETATRHVGQPLPAPGANVESPSAAPMHEPWITTDTAQSTMSAHDYDASTNTITFASAGLPSIQRTTDESAPATEAAAPVAAAPAMTSAPAASGSGAPAAAGTDVDELVNRVYDALAARLRAELWLDRERAGTLMDLGR